MALALIYIFAAAKPFSIRRLVALFTVALILATPALEILGVRSAQSNALIIATSLTLLVWSIPLFRLSRDSICSRSLTLDALRRVSEAVQLTYAFGFVGLSTIAASVTLSGAKTLTLGHLIRLVPTTFVMALIVRIIFLLASRKPGRMRQRPIRIAGYGGSASIVRRRGDDRPCDLPLTLVRISEATAASERLSERAFRRGRRPRWVAQLRVLRRLCAL